MAKVPVPRSKWKIDPAELAVAQERTEARLADLFSHRATVRHTGPRPPIIVDGVELIGAPDEPPAPAAPADQLSLVADAGRGTPEPLADLVGVFGASSAPLVPVMSRHVPAMDLLVPAVDLRWSAPHTQGLVAVMDVSVAPTRDLPEPLAVLPEPAPTMPELADLPELAAMPELADLPEVAEPAPTMPELAVVPELAELPEVAEPVPTMPELAVVPELADLPEVAEPAPTMPELAVVPELADLPEPVAEPLPPLDLADPPAILPPEDLPEPAVTANRDADEPAMTELSTAEAASDVASAVGSAAAALIAVDVVPLPATPQDSPPQEAPAVRPVKARPVKAKAPATKAKARPVTAKAPATKAKAPATKAAGPAASAVRPNAPRTAVAATPPAIPILGAALCPYCARLLQPPPTASRHCPRCRQQIVVKRVEGHVAYLTEAAIAVFEAERRKDADAERFSRDRDRWLKLAGAARAPAGSIRRIASAHASPEVVEAARALYTTAVDRAFQSAKRGRRWEDAARVRRDQAAALHRMAGSPKPPADEAVAVHREGVAAELRGLAEIVRDAELVSGDCCETCRIDDRRIVTISKELVTPSLPHQGCPRGLCRCGWDLATRDREAVLRYLRRRPRPAAHVNKAKQAPKA